MRRASTLTFGLIALGLVAAGDQAPAPPAPTPAPAELTLEQLLAQRGWVAIRLHENAFSQLETEVVVNGEHHLRAQISTSFSKTLFDEATVKKLGLRIDPTRIELAGAEKQRLGTVQLDELAFGNTKLGPTTIFTASLESFVKSASDDPVQAVIGSDLLTKYQAVLEIQAPRLYLRVR